MNSKGITLIELLVVVAIIAILAVALAFSYQGWQGAYKVERDTKNIYTDLMDARGRAISRGQEYFADFNTPAPAAGQGTYRIIEDTNGNVANNAGAGDNVLLTFPKTVAYAVTWAGGTIQFNRRGIVQPSATPLGGTICIFTDFDPDYDCIVISRTRINMGKIITQDTAGGECDAANCNVK